MNDNPWPDSPSDQSMERLPVSREQVRLDVERLWRQVEQRHETRNRVRQSVTRVGLLASALAIIGSGLVWQHTRDNGFPAPTAVAMESRQATARAVNDLQPANPSDGVEDLSPSAAAYADDLMQLQQTLAQLRIEGERLQRLRWQQETWIVREELSRTALPNVDFH